MCPVWLRSDDVLGTSQGDVRCSMLYENLPVELDHEHCRGVVGNSPKAGHHGSGASLEESVRQTDQAFAADLAPEGGLTATQHDEIRVESEVCEVEAAQDAVAGGTVC